MVAWYKNVANGDSVQKMQTYCGLDANVRSWVVTFREVFDKRRLALFRQTIPCSKYQEEKKR